MYRPLDLLTLNLGARLDIDSVFGARVSPRLAVVLTPTDGTTLRASYAEAFRGPTSLEMHDVDVTYKIPPRSLKPELERTAELSLQQRIGFLTLDLRGFVAFYDDLVNLRDATSTEYERAVAGGLILPSADPAYVDTIDNVDAMRSYGGSLTEQLRPIERLGIAASSTYSRTFTGGAEAPLWPRLFGNFRVSYALRENGPTLAFAAIYAHKRRAFNDIPLALVQSPYATDQLELRLTVSGHVRAVPGLHVRGGLGAQVKPDLPYLVAAPVESAPDVRVQYVHSQAQVYLMVGAQYQY